MEVSTRLSFLLIAVGGAVALLLVLLLHLLAAAAVSMEEITAMLPTTTCMVTATHTATATTAAPTTWIRVLILRLLPVVERIHLHSRSIIPQEELVATPVLHCVQDTASHVDF